MQLSFVLNGCNKLLINFLKATSSCNYMQSDIYLDVLLQKRYDFRSRPGEDRNKVNTLIMLLVMVTNQA